MPAPAARTELRMTSALSASAETTRAAEMVAEHCAASLPDRPDFAAVFFSAHHSEMADEIAAILQRRLSPRALVGVSAVGVIGDATELEQTPGLSLLAGTLPDASVHAFTTDDLPSPDEPEPLAAATGLTPDTRAMLLFADPFSTPLVKLLPGLNRARPSPTTPILGGLASAATEAGRNVMLLNDRVVRTGGVGLTIGGRFRVDTLLSQGCLPFGPLLVVTKAKRNIIFELGGRPALEAVSEAVQSLPEPARESLKTGLFIGRVINEYKDRFGRDDFLIRSVLGVDNNRGAVAVAEPTMHVGQTVRLHLRDAHTAHEDLSLLLDAQRLHDRPRGVLLVSCNQRGRRLFDAPNHDAGLISRAFLPGPGGEQLAKPGRPYGATPPSVPLAGFFALGEIGPIAGENFVHGQTACAAMFRE